MSELERRRLWVRTGGLCTLCKKDLMRGSLTWEEMLLGEGAHIVGQKQTTGSPGGGPPAGHRTGLGVEHLARLLELPSISSGSCG
jgi:hypothetical protein